MLASVLTIVRTPSRERRRLTAPMRTPSAVESRNVVSVRSTTIRVRPDSSASPRAALSSGAVNRSISPATATTCLVSSIGSLLRLNSGGIGPSRLTDLAAERRAPLSRAEVQAQDELSGLAVGGGAGLHVVGDAIEDVAHAGQVAVGQQPAPAVRAQLPDPQLEALVVGGDHDVDVLVARVDRCMGGDGVGEQDGVVEPVDGALGASGEHTDHAPEDRADQRATADVDDGLVGRAALGHAKPPLVTGSPSSKVMRTSVSSSLPVPSSSDSASVAISGSPSPRPGLSGRGTIPRPRSVTTRYRRRSSMEARRPMGPSPSG